MLFDIFIIVSYLIYILLGIGFLSTYPTFLTYMNNIIRIYICFFILDRFNPFRNIKCTSLDRKVMKDFRKELAASKKDGRKVDMTSAFNAVSDRFNRR